MIKQLVAAALGLAAISCQGQVRVIDSQPSGSATPPPRTVVAPDPAAASAAPSSQLTQLYYQLQTLQQEVQQLRGLVEEQAHQIRQLKQQRMDDYLDLDRRISELSSSGGSSASAAPSAPGGGSATAVAGRDELTDYRAAIDLVLKQEDFDKGIVALEKHLKDYPNGRYAANAKYWLGQIYMLKNQLEQSRQWFTAMLQDHPEHQKAPEAKFKLGKVYDLLGDKAQARSLLEEVAASGTNAASLAREYLRQNFSS